MKEINRREFIGTTAKAAAGLALLGNRPFSGVSDRPNIVFILTDDHRYGAFGFMDKPWLKTPNMDRLAREGVQFTNSFVTTSLCSPSRASFLTGQYASRHGVKNNITPWRESNVTFLELLKAKGYHTGFIGKWHMPGKGIPDLVGQGKVDRMVSFSIFEGQGIYNNCPLIVDGKTISKKGYITDVLTDYALDFMNEKRDRPFCLFLSHKAVHYGFVPPKRYKGKLDGAPFHEMEKIDHPYPTGIMQFNQVLNFKKNQQRYYEALMAVDDSVGKVLDYLDAKGLAENTLVVYVGDNGYFWGEHGLIDKRYAYEESIRIPHLVRYPKLIKDGGKQIPEMTLNIDFMPTLLEAAGIKVPRQVQGKSYLELCAGKDVSWRTSWLYEYFKDPSYPTPEIRAVRTNDWKLITYRGRYTRFFDELYDLVNDPGERNNLAKDSAYETKKQELKKELARLIKEAL